MMLQSERPNCTPCEHCGRCNGCGIQLVINRNKHIESCCPLCRRYTDNGMTRAPRLSFLDDVRSGAVRMVRKGLAIVEQAS